MSCLSRGFRKWLKAQWATVSALLPRVFVREAEVDALVDTGVDHLLPAHPRSGYNVRVSSMVGPVLVVVTEKVMLSFPKKSARVRVAAR